MSSASNPDDAQQPARVVTRGVRATVGEGPVWITDHQRILWLDIASRRVFLTEADTGVTTIAAAPAFTGAMVPRKTGGYIAATCQGICLVSAQLDHWEPVCDPEGDLPGNRFNDGRCDRFGRFWFGSVDRDEQRRTGSLYVLDTNLQCRRIVDGLFLSNGLDWSPCGTTFYLTDTLDRTIWAFDYDGESCSLSHRRPFAVVPEEEGLPDGLCVDASGGVWSARWGSARVVRYSPDGSVDLIWPLPVSKVTACCFGGMDLRTLYVTTACLGANQAAFADEPEAGELFKIETQYEGQPTTVFDG